MRFLKVRVRFTTPAFLGDARQSGRWRTPPFKALLRQWWRVAYAAQHDNTPDMESMRREEGELFGNAWLSHHDGQKEVADHCKSRIRMRLDRWDEGRLTSWDQLEQRPVSHPEVKNTGYKVGPHAYLGFGPLDGRRGTRMDPKRNAAIQAQESATLSLAFPESHEELLTQALWLMDRYGTVGGRSRNGWGSLHFSPEEDESFDLSENIDHFARTLKDALELNWPHAIGLDETGAPLIWQTANEYDNWRSLMRELAILKIGVRTQFVFPQERSPHQRPYHRHWLAYPVTRHEVKAWKKGSRLPNTLRFKVRETEEGKLAGVVYHMPYLPPKQFRPDKQAIQETWRTVHQLLDELTRSPESRSYTMITAPQRRGTLESSLSQVKLTRLSE
jgi:CRISPR-associated protein Cmr1